MTTHKENSEFLLGLLLEENKHLNLIDFIDRSDRTTSYACVCVSMGIGESYNDLKNVFTNTDQFSSKYFDIYASALENYRSIVGTDVRQIYFDEAKIFYPTPYSTITITKLVSNANNKNNAMQYLDSIKNSYAIILRDEIAFIIIHYNADDYIVIDPHVEFSGILSKTGVYRYVTYDLIWDFDVSILLPTKTNDNAILLENNNIQPTINNSTIVDVSEESINPQNGINH